LNVGRLDGAVVGDARHTRFVTRVS